MVNIAEIAAVAHEANRGICEAIGDDSQKPWAAAAQWQRDSAINGVRFHLANPNALPSAGHVNWMQEKLDAGWVRGPRKDPDATPPTHHCLVPYDELPVEQRIKDHVFRAIVHAMAWPEAA